jgi:enoyl-CoA hydratase/carnithine racemase
MTDTTSVLREKRGQAFWITINRPDKRNAINGDVVAGIARGYREAHDDKDVRVIVRQGVLCRRRSAEQRRRLCDGFFQAERRLR